MNPLQIIILTIIIFIIGIPIFVGLTAANFLIWYNKSPMAYFFTNVVPMPSFLAKCLASMLTLFLSMLFLLIMIAVSIPIR